MWSPRPVPRAPCWPASASSSRPSPPISGSTSTTSSSAAARCASPSTRPPGRPSGVTLDTLALASRLVSRELDHHDPVPGTTRWRSPAPGVERTLRTPAHFQREVGKVVSIRLADVGHDERRVSGVLVAADDTTATVTVDAPDGPTERTVRYDQIDRAKTVFEWPAPSRPSRGAAPSRPRRATKRKKEHSS